MANLKDCITSAARQGLMSQDLAQTLHKRYDELARLALAPPEIRERILAELSAEAIERRRVELLDETKRLELETTILSHKDARGRAAPHQALWMLVEHFGQAPFQDAAHKMLAILGRAHAELEELLHEFRKGFLSGEYRRRGADMMARMENVVRELFGESTGDARAAQLAEAWANVAEKLRVRFNAAGGAIGKLKNWGLPQVHSAEALLAAGKDTWKKFIAPLLDRERMLNPLTGQRMTDTDLDASLDHIFDTIVADGWNTRDPSGQPQGRGALFKRHADHRFLHFRDADAWLEYQRAFGEGDPFASMMGHLSLMARDIAAMEVLGPNPEAMLNRLRQTAIKANGGQTSDPVNRALNKLDNMWAHYKGSANMPVSRGAANVVATTRNLISAASLGSAAISAISDRGFDAVTRGFVGLPVHGALTTYLRSFGPGMERHAARAGLILDSALHAMHQHARYMGSISGRTISGYVNERVLSLSGLQAMTQASKHAFGLDFQAAVADIARFAWDEIPNQGRQAAAMRRTLERHGFDAASWDAIRAARQYQPERGEGFVAPAGAEGTGILRPQEVADAAGEDLADRYLSMILRETRFATPESTIASRAAMIGTNQPGTFLGELVRSAGQFKSFGVAVVSMHGGRILRELVGGNPARGAVYFGAILIATTLLGGVAMQLKEIANGRDPRRMDLSKKGAKFWGAAILQGGGLGIYGDFLFSDVNRFGGSLAGTVAGPMVERLDAVRRLTVGNVLEFGSGQERTNFGRELTRFIGADVPGSSLWYARLAWNRVLIDQLQYLADPEAHTSFRRQMQRRRVDYGQQFWWAPGESEPRRGPDLGAMFPPY